MSEAAMLSERLTVVARDHDPGCTCQAARLKSFQHPAQPTVQFCQAIVIAIACHLNLLGGHLGHIGKMPVSKEISLFGGSWSEAKRLCRLEFDEVGIVCVEIVEEGKEWAIKVPLIEPAQKFLIDGASVLAAEYSLGPLNFAVIQSERLQEFAADAGTSEYGLNA